VRRHPFADQDADHPPDTDYAEPVPPMPERIPATGFLFPDVPDEWNHATSYDGRLFSTNFSFVPLIDYTAFVQDDDRRLKWASRPINGTSGQCG
jgi:hypothetical protein